ncbi:hypothetical protein LCGC14_0738430 [marine sediment metagenome]|uniref:Uncharacterized protein n=1 Tax=marine sediment metagenome TaxID=412755 RepID=A0A0F9QSI7_9ZZZZ
MAELKDDIVEIKEDVKIIRKVLMGEGDTNPHGGLVGKVIKIDTKQKIIIGIMSALGLGALGLVYGIAQYLITNGLINLP